MTKQIAIFSDIHGNLPALEAILADIKSHNITDIICLGDIVGIGPCPKECMNLIISNRVQLILGNHELYSLKGVYIDGEYEDLKDEHEKWMRNQLTKQQLAFLETCPMQIKKQIDGHTFAFQHFIFNPDETDTYPFAEFETVDDGSIKNLAAKVKADTIFVGHRHDPFTLSTKAQKLIDVGSSGCVKTDQTFYHILSVKDGNIDIQKITIDYDRAKFKELLNSVDYPAKNMVAQDFFGIY